MTQLKFFWSGDWPKIEDIELNKILKYIWSLFFKDVSVEFKNDKLTIEVQENPIIENINYSGIKAKKFLRKLKKIEN